MIKLKFIIGIIVILSIISLGVLYSVFKKESTEDEILRISKEVNMDFESIDNSEYAKKTVENIAIAVWFAKEIKLPKAQKIESNMNKVMEYLINKFKLGEINFTIPEDVVNAALVHPKTQYFLAGVMRLAFEADLLKIEKSLLVHQKERVRLQTQGAYIKLILEHLNG